MRWHQITQSKKNATKRASSSNDDDVENELALLLEGLSKKKLAQKVLQRGKPVAVSNGAQTKPPKKKQTLSSRGSIKERLAAKKTQRTKPIEGEDGEIPPQ